MSTILLTRVDRFAIHLEFDLGGAAALLEALQSALRGETNPVNIVFDRGVIKKKRFSKTTERTLTICVGADDEIQEVNDQVTLRLESETMQMAVKRFQDCLKSGEFQPPEFCELRVCGRDMDNDVYCILK